MILLSLFLSSCHPIKQIFKKKTTGLQEHDVNHLNYVVDVPSKYKLSTNPLVSDLGRNQALLEHVVGTLIRYEPSGRYEKYLLAEWSSSKDGKVWKFKLKPNLISELGTPLTAKGYLLGLKNVLQIYYSHFGPDLIFSKVAGYDNFIKENRDFKGIKTLGSLEFQFTFLEQPADLIETLSIPYYGYYTSRNFDKKMKWLSSSFLDSTASYKIEKFNKTLNEVKLVRRNDWAATDKEAPLSVSIFLGDYEKRPLPKGHLIVRRRLFEKSEVPMGMKYLKGTNVWISNFVLSPTTEVFKTREHRVLFKNAIREYTELKPQVTLSSRSTFKFYPSFVEKNVEAVAPRFRDSIAGKTISVYMTDWGGASYSEKAIAYAAKKLKLKLKLSKPKFSPQLDRDLKANSKFDIRHTFVIADYEVKVSMIKMMFCSKMGVSFPDPSGEVCRLTSMQEKVKNVDFPTYLKGVQQALDKDASVIPVYRYGPGWLYTDDINNPGVSPVVSSPRFDKVRL